MPRPRGRPPKPIEEKFRTGNPGRRPLPDRASLTILPGADGPPEPARPLGQQGRALWDRIWSAGATWLAERVDVEQVLILCERMDERVALRVKVLRDGDWRERAGLRALEDAITSDLAALAFNPVERSRLGVAEVKAAESTLDKIAARRAARS